MPTQAEIGPPPAYFVEWPISKFPRTAEFAAPINGRMRASFTTSNTAAPRLIGAGRRSLTRQGLRSKLRRMSDSPKIGKAGGKYTLVIDGRKA